MPKSVTDYGAVGKGTDDTVAFQKAANDPAAGVIEVPPGDYRISQTVTLPPYVTFQGEGVKSMVLALPSLTSGPVFKLTGLRSILRDLNIAGPKMGASGAAVLIDPSSVEAEISGCRIFYGQNCIQAFGADFDIHTNVALGNAYGSSLIWVKGGGGGYARRVKADHSSPGVPVNEWFYQTPWTANTAVPLNYVIGVGQYYLLCVKAGTTGSSLPVVPNYDDPPSQDGSAAWALFAPTRYFSTVIDSGTFAWWEYGCDHTGPFVAGTYVTNSDGQPGPQAIHVDGADYGGYWQAAVMADAGNDITIANSQNGAPTSSSKVIGRCGLYTLGNFIGDVKFVNNTFVGCDYGILAGAGKGFLVDSNIFGGCNSALREAGATNILFNGNILSSPEWGPSGSPQGNVVMGSNI